LNEGHAPVREDVFRDLVLTQLQIHILKLLFVLLLLADRLQPLLTVGVSLELEQAIGYLAEALGLSRFGSRFQLRIL